MSIATGRKILAATEAFNARKDQQKGVITTLAKTLAKRPFGEKHFEQAKRYFEDLLSDAPVKIGQQFNEATGATLKERELSFFMAYMGLRKDERGQADIDSFVPHIMSGRMRQNMMFFGHRALPLTFSSHHIENQYKYRTWGEDLDYQSADFQYSLLTGYLIAQILGLEMRDKDLPSPNVFVPDTRGAYLGMVQSSDPRAYLPVEGCIVSRDANKVFNYGAGNNQILRPAIIPHAHITLLTFVNSRKLKPDQQALMDLFNPVLRDENTRICFEHIMNQYPTGLLGSIETPEMRARLNHLFVQFTDIIRSEEWIAVTTHSPDRGRRKDFH